MTNGQAVISSHTVHGPRQARRAHWQTAVFGVAATLLALLAACERSGPAGHAPAGQPADTPVVEHDVAITMRDGVVLRADIYRPAAEGPFPVLVYRTPYDKSAAAESYTTHTDAVARGYAVVLGDVRGRYASDGVFDPYRNEGKDGYDTIEWAAAQDWSDGIVGTFGLSYPGAVQWLAALESPPSLKAMVPAMTFSSPRRFFYTNGVFDLSWLPWIYTNVAPDARSRKNLPGITSGAEARRRWPEVADDYRDFLPLADLPWLRDAAPFYFEWLRHPPESDWWDWAEIQGNYASIDAAVLHLSGWHDESYGSEGAATNFNGIKASRDGRRPAANHLMLGPWTHGVGATMSRKFGDLDFGDAAAIDYNAEILDFFDHYLRGVNNRYSGMPPVRYFVMGANRWRTSTAWPPAGADTRTMYLAANGPQRQLLPEMPTNGASDSRFEADPADPVVDPHGSFGPHDFKGLALREDVLTFDTEPLGGDLTIAGAIEARINASCDCRDFDLWVRVYHVHPDGRVINLMSPGNDMLRVSYRDGGTGRQLIEPGRVYELTLDQLVTANRFSRGDRIRVQISASFAPHFSRNLQTGESEVTSDRARAATITIHHDPSRPSLIQLPVISE